MKLMLNGKEVSGMGHYVMAGDIKDATAEDSNVLSGKVYYNNNGKREGTMPNRGGMSAELAAGGSVSIPEGYHNGEGVVRAQDLASQTAGTAAAANIEAGYTAWVNGEMVEGTGSIIGSHSYKQVSAPDAGSGTYGVHNQSVQLDKTKSYVFLVYYNNPNKATLHFGTITKGVMTGLLSHGSTTSYNKKPALSSECVLSYGPGYDSDKTTNALIYELTGGE